jgi:DNA primase
MNATEEIKSRLDIIDIVQEYLPLRKSGTSYSGFCPFHSNTRTPAFVVFPDSQTWRCFGACAEGGDLFSFMMKKEGWDFKETLKNLADRAGVELEQYTPDQAAALAEQAEITDLLTAASDYFHQLLLYAPEAEHARQYVANRGLTAETIAEFKIGFSLNSWDAARTHFQAQGYSIYDLLDAGLLTKNEEKGTIYDRFRHRLMIPIRNTTGDVVGFGARTFDPDGLPKYLNSPQTKAFDKSRLLYGLDMAKRHVRDARQAVIVEGYMDVIMAWQSGFRNVVAQMGTALTGDQLGLLKRYTKQFVIALDADNAGMKATLRSLEVARKTLDREADTSFDARGLIRHEGRLKADIRVATMPQGKDPDNIIRENPEQWRGLIANAKPVVEYVIDVLSADLDLTDAKAKTDVAQQILPLIEDVADPIERSHFRQHLARVLHTDERALRQVKIEKNSWSSAKRQSQTPPPDNNGGMPPPPDNFDDDFGGIPSTLAPRHAQMTIGQTVDIDKRQANYLRQILEYPHLHVQICQTLKATKQPILGEADFASTEYRAIFKEIVQNIEDGVVVTAEELCDNLAEPLATRWRIIAAQIPISTDTSSDRLADTLVLSVLDWRLEKVKQSINEVTVLFNQAKMQGDEAMIALFGQQLRELPMTVLGIHRAKGARSAVQRRQKEENRIVNR